MLDAPSSFVEQDSGLSMQTWERTTLGRTGREVGRLGISASYGVPAAAVEQAFERGVNYLYWGSMRKEEFGRALRNLMPQRDRMVLVLQSYSRMASLVGWSVERALRKLGTGHADVLLLGMWNKPVPDRILDASRKVRDRGLVRHIAVSSHHRPLIPNLAKDSDLDVLHVRYNAVHPGAEREVFPYLPQKGTGPGIVAFTATSWRQLLDPKKLPKGEKIPTAVDCYRFALSNPAVDVCMAGPSTAEHVEESLEALSLGPMSEQELSWMHRVGAAIHG
jgi:aryl-alcohol dehydrogenase-like predicted oxidoreductase